MKMRVGIIGCVAQGHEAYDGQTVSTRNWLAELRKNPAVKKVCVVDTYAYKKRIFQVMWQWIKCMFTCSHVVIMLSGNGLYFFLPLIYHSNKLFRRKFYHRVIGGELDTLLKQLDPKFISYVNALEVNWVQSNSLVKKLEALGVGNAEYLENFRDIQPVELPEKVQYEKPFRFCTFSRVSKSKGIGLAIEAVAGINEKMGQGTACLDVYGPVEDTYSQEFYGLVEQYKDCVRYMGSIPSSEAVGTLKDYYMHLFPTTWSGEGFPGTLIDCYNAGLPTIASDWAYNSEYLREGETGLLYDWHKPELLAKRIEDAIAMAPKIMSMRRSCLEEAKKYRCDVVMEKIMTRMQQ